MTPIKRLKRASLAVLAAIRLKNRRGLQDPQFSDQVLASQRTTDKLNQYLLGIDKSFNTYKLEKDNLKQNIKELQKSIDVLTTRLEEMRSQNEEMMQSKQKDVEKAIRKYK